MRITRVTRSLIAASAVVVACAALPGYAAASGLPRNLPHVEGVEVALPAYGHITINALGGNSWTYDDVDWDCSSTTTGFPVRKVVVECEPRGESTWTCPLMIVTASVAGGQAGGTASCNDSATLDTGVATGYDTQRAVGSLGTVSKITCTAYPGSLGYLVPQYVVTCSEPGLPLIND